MDRTLKGVVAALVCAAILGVAFYGTYMPLRKAEMYIGTLQAFQANPPSSIQDFETRLEPALDYPSPIGQEELVRNTANTILGFVQRGLDPTSTAELVGFLNVYYDPILSSGKGMSFGQDVYLEGAINEIAFANTGAPAYLAAAAKYYELGAELGPNRPQVLYGLFDVYRAMNDATGTKAVAAKIMQDWPTDTRIPQALTAFEGAGAGKK